MAVLGSGMLLVDGALADGVKRPAKAKVRQHLLSQGYLAPRVSCQEARRGGRVCAWRADRRGFRHCQGRARVRRPGAGVRVTRRPCRALTIGFNEWISADNADLQDDVGATVRRMFVPWRAIEPSPGVFLWDEYDRVYRALRERGLRPLLVVGQAPCWTRLYVQCTNLYEGPPDPAFDPFWQRYVRAAAARYPEAYGVEVWSEPNLTLMFEPEVDPPRYTQLLRLAYNGVKSVSSMPVATGGMFATPVSGPMGMADEDFLAALYANGAARFMDAISLHPFPISPDEYDPALTRETFLRMRTVRDAAGDHRTPFWVTEIGASTRTGPGFPDALTEAEQSDLLLGLLRGFIRRPDVPLAILHRLVDSPELPPATLASYGTHLFGFGVYYPAEEGFGAFLEGGAAKRIACDLARELGGALDC